MTFQTCLGCGAIFVDPGFGPRYCGSCLEEVRKNLGKRLFPFEFNPPGQYAEPQHWLDDAIKEAKGE